MNVKAYHINVTSFDLSKAMTFSRIFNKVKLSPSARLTLRCLVDFWNPEKGLVYPGQKTISECTGVSLRSVNAAVDELRKAGLLLTTGNNGGRLKYYFTNYFFKLVEIAQGKAKTSQVTYAESSYHEQHEIHEQNNKQNKIISFELTEFQKRYQDVFEKLSEYELKKYKILKGWEKEEWLKAKKQEFNKLQSSSELLHSLNESKQKTTSPLDFNKEEAIEWLNSLPQFAKNGYFAAEIRKKWNL